MGKIETGHFYLLLKDILPHIHLCPVGYWKNTEVLAHCLTTIKYVPQFRALILRIPLAKLITMAEESLLCSRLFLVAACTTNSSIEMIFLYRIQQCGSLQLISRSIITGFLFHTTSINTLLHRTNYQFCPKSLCKRIAIIYRLLKIVTCVDVHQGKRNLGRIERLICKMNDYY